MKIKYSRRLFLGKSAFTLIELLVVVLIIGILAAVALPQYNKAVEKSRAAEAITMLKTLQEACEVVFLETGEIRCYLDENTNVGTVLDLSSMRKVGYAWAAYCSSSFCYTTRGNSEIQAIRQSPMTNYIGQNAKYTLQAVLSKDGKWTKTYTPVAGFNMDLTSYFESMGFTKTN